MCNSPAVMKRIEVESRRQQNRLWTFVAVLCYDLMPKNLSPLVEHDVTSNIDMSKSWSEEDDD